MGMIKEIIDKILGKPVKLNDTLKPVQLELGQSIKAERRSLASELGNGKIAINEKKAIKKMEEKSKESKTKSETIKRIER